MIGPGQGDARARNILLPRFWFFRVTKRKKCVSITSNGIKARNGQKTKTRKRFQGFDCSASVPFLGIVPQILIGIVLFLSGLNLKDNGYRYTGLALMILGSALGLGLGFGSLISEFE